MTIDPMTLTIILIAIVVLLVATRSTRSNISTDAPDHSTSRDGRSYLYYLDRSGQQRYDEDICRGCIENRVAELQRKGYVVTEVVLGNRYSGDL